MKRIFILLISLLLINYTCFSRPKSTESNLSPTDSIRILSSPDLHDLTVKWADEYNKAFPQKGIKAIIIPDNKINNELKRGDIGFISGESSAGTDESFWKMPVARDVIVPVINSENPFLEEISQNGISPEKLGLFFSNPGLRNWSSLLDSKRESPAEVYFTGDESLINRVAEFLNIDKKLITGIRVNTDEDLLSAIQKNSSSIGFCRLISLTGLNKQSADESISILPIDRNGNGKIDYQENIYTDLNAFERGVWIGKYPRILISNIYSITAAQPENENVTAFLKWVLNDGQQYLYSFGYSALLANERQSNTDKLFTAKYAEVAVTGEKSVIKSLLLFLAALVVIGFLVDFSVRSVRHRMAERIPTSGTRKVLDENLPLLPKGLYFDKTHTWAFMEQNGIVKVGIDDFLQHITGNITRIRLKNEGDQVKKGEEILTLIQNGKQLNIYSPVSGIIREKNTLLDINAGLVNSSPYNNGWIYRIEPVNWLRETQLLFMAEKHRIFIKDEITRLKDFLTGFINNDSVKYAPVILQDGGGLIDGPLENMGPEVWEDFQTKFIDPSRQVWFYEIF